MRPRRTRGRRRRLAARLDHAGCSTLRACSLEVATPPIVAVEVLANVAAMEAARQSTATGTTRVFVVTAARDATVLAYYGWCMAQLEAAAAPPRLRKGAGRYPQPVALLARLGVDIGHEWRGLGAAMLQDVLARLLELSAGIGCRGLLVHAESAEAGEFYPIWSPSSRSAQPTIFTSSC